MDANLEQQIIALAIEKNLFTQQDIDQLIARRPHLTSGAARSYCPIDQLLQAGLISNSLIKSLSEELIKRSATDISTVKIIDKVDKLARHKEVTAKLKPEDAIEEDNLTLDYADENATLKVTIKPADEEEHHTLKYSNQPESIYSTLESKARQANKEKTLLPGQSSITEIGRYQVIELLGEGGMGSVYKAFDPLLNRFVALKFLHSKDDDSIKRLLLEGRAQAKIDHPNVCKVYEIGDLDGQCFIAMQFINGQTLNKLMKELNIEEKVKIIAEVADGLHASHKEGLIHRDIKPQNIIVEKTPDDQWRPYIMDFGLVREISHKGITVTGEVLGTPCYMPPEQIKGKTANLDRRTDVYSLGATMYEILCGRPPFEGFTVMEVLNSVLREEAEPLRKIDANIPVKLETIVAKCMEKEMSRRYESARSLALDLAHYLNGEEIEAQPVSWQYRWLTKARNNKEIVIVSAIAMIIILILSGVGLQIKLSAIEQAKLAQQFGQKAKEIEMMMRIASLMPLHDTRREKANIKQRIDEIETEMIRFGRNGEGPGNYSIGRGYLALHNYEAARKHLEEAWRQGFQTSEVAYALGQVMGQLYQKNSSLADQIADPQLRAERKSYIEKTYRDPALKYLQAANNLQFESPAYVEGLIAFYENRYDDALAKARQAFEQLPMLYEAKKLQADIYMLLASELQSKGEYSAAKQQYQRAGEIYQEALAIGESDAELYLNESDRRTRLMELMMVSGNESADVCQLTFENALRACDQVLKADPENSEAYSTKSRIYWRWGEFQTNFGVDPEPLMLQAIGAAHKAIEGDAGNITAYDNLGNAYLIQAGHVVDSGKDPRPLLKNAIESYQKALQINPGFALSYNGIGLAYWKQGEYEREHGANPQQALERAIENYQQAIKINAGNFPAFINMGLSYWTRGDYEKEHGIDPRPSLEQAIANFEKAIELNPNFADAYTTIGLAYQTRAEYEKEQGSDPQAALTRAIESFQKTIQINEKDIYAYANISAAYNTIALYLLENNRDPKEFLKLSRAALVRSIQLDPDDFNNYVTQSNANLIAARQALQLDQSPAQYFQEIEASLKIALQKNSEEVEIYQAWAEYYRWLAQWQVKTKRPALETLKKGLASVERALAINPRLARTIAIQGSLLLAKAHLEQQPAGSSASAQAAHQALTRAIEMNPLLNREYLPLLLEAKKLITE